MERSMILCFVVLSSSQLGVFGFPVSVEKVSTVNEQTIIRLSTSTEQNSTWKNFTLDDALEEFILSTAFYLELFNRHSGFRNVDFYTPREDRELQVIAVASANVWSKLYHIEELDALFWNSSWSLAESIVRSNFSSNGSLLVKNDLLMKELFKGVEKNILAKDSLAPSYRDERTKAEKLTFRPLVNITADNDPILIRSPRYRNFAIRLLVLDYLPDKRAKVNDTAELQRYASSKAVMALAKTAKGSKMQEIFDQAVDITVDKLGISTNSTESIEEIFFTTLEEKLKTIPELNDEFAAIKSDIIKKRKI